MAGIVPLPPGAAVAAAEGLESHPLLNPVVLKRLFEVIPFELQEFRNFRLVSLTWSNLSLSKWRQNAWLNLIESDEGSPKISLWKYLRLIENDEHQLIQHPFRKYFLTMWNINIQEEQVPLQFWNRVGPLMRHLIVEKSKFFSAADVRAVIFDKTPNLERLSLIMNYYQSRTKRPDKRKKRLDPKLPQHAATPRGRVQKNLKELDIDLIIRGEDGEEGIIPNVAAIQINLPFTWMELLLHFPNIKKLGPLQLSFRVNAEVELLEFFESVEVLRKNYGPRYLADLQDLDLTHLAAVEARAFSGVFVSCLNRLQFPLKRLALTLGYSVDEKIFKKLLQGCVNTLEYLSVAREGLPFQNFPFGLKFIALKELTLVGPFAPNLMFLKECPNLEVFRLITPFIAGRLEADLTQLVEKNDGNPPKLEKMKELWITNDGCCAEEVRKLGQLMPNIRRLRMGLDNGSFRAVCGVWKELEHLTIVPWRVEESALLGKDEESKENFRHPNLTELKNLKSFKMQNIKMLRDRQGLTNAGILEGILALPNLEVVNLCISSEVSREVRNQLARRFPKYFIFSLEGVRGGI